ncbi:hypothetical protein [Hydrogenibacillus sp. N12]|uniref:hypothetical protein n=1 Tax=Hydrogenibacillus sp. N12 TaxID=2866627 RepID=UPI001C7CE095|nr:hypothetical protein [Hydrogenibacillus sp. N12]QZA33696.1 hypothetical protein K2M58_04015 [Hydrogenibacillus sp. N12]
MARGLPYQYAETIWVDEKSIVEAAGLNLLFEKGMLACFDGMNSIHESSFPSKRWGFSPAF